MKATKWNNANGELSAYSLACGCVQTETRKGRKVELFHDGNYTVRAYDVEKVAPYVGCLGIETDERQTSVAWECFYGLTEARKRYRELLNKR